MQAACQASMCTTVANVQLAKANAQPSSVSVAGGREELNIRRRGPRGATNVTVSHGGIGAGSLCHPWSPRTQVGLLEVRHRPLVILVL